MSAALALQISTDGGGSVSALLSQPDEPRAACVLAHGAGAGMSHPFMSAVASGLAERGVAALRFQFPFMERGSKRADPPRIAQACVRAAVATAAARLPCVPLFAGGKSFGGRMTSQADAATPLVGVEGLFFIGFPLHPPGAPAIERATHLTQVTRPMLFLQGTRDELAELPLVTSVVAGLGERATLVIVDDADHAFHVRAKSGRRDPEVLATMLDALVTWMARIVAGSRAEAARDGTAPG
jgi:predicted alpha/beta-hydrolase family hydrolase